MKPTFSLTRSLALACAATAAFTLSGCDDRQFDAMLDTIRQGFKAFFDSVKPDALLLKGLTPGVSTLEQVREQMGKPETERVFDDGSRRLEYPRGPQGLKTWMVDIGPNGRLVAITQALTAENFAKIRVGMSEDEVRRLLGKPGQVAGYRLKKETVWSWKWLEGGVTPEAYFNVHFGPDGRVTTTSRSDIIRGR
ncbi:outer membrane protein assembly factor BamE [Paraburkholderia sp. CNPSo 3274]|uniref:outer membrane protein assembly factor BamE n=1 Tax=unclassified Paraburkholderia TaxID=2615204 RepID=UPI0020B7F84B|nr:MULTISPECIES: outer membrane protein assembly factor BamE [unclassified Paraburkholderia]MCP3707549.1 outer membrane protein assembly factor BamE [Paraburkholderia sp. CNPSo 3274]MCP3720047.1 outer membrane protein assembly factor BamE [Paraburkholderia sp. CNPSo 3281]